jgi:tetratricopeptide (TPR) repeat protein
MFYIGKLILPLDLTALYPILPGAPAFSIQNFAGVLGVFCVSAACFIYRKERPYLAAAWLYYVLTLLPVLGVLQVGAQAAADRYAYLPGISLFLLFSAGVVSLFSGRRILLAGVGGVAALALGLGTVRQTAAWKDPVTLWENVVRVFPEGSQVAHGNLANAYKAAGRLDEALQEYDKSIAIPPPHAYPHDGKGTLLFDRGFPDEAIREFKTSIALDPAYASPHRNLWFVYEKKGMHEEALKEVLEAIRIDPDFAEAYNNLAISYGAMGDFRRSEQASRKALSLDPANPKYIVNLATTYQRAEKYDEAIALYRKALELNSTDPVYFFNLGNTYLLRGMLPEAIEMIRAALRLQPGNPGLYRKLGEAYERSGQRELAAENYAKARELTEELKSKR